jgi:hypothetical protein
MVQEEACRRQQQEVEEARKKKASMEKLRVTLRYDLPAWEGTCISLIAYKTVCRILVLSSIIKCIFKVPPLID